MNILDFYNTKVSILQGVEDGYHSPEQAVKRIAILNAKARAEGLPINASIPLDDLSALAPEEEDESDYE